MKRINVTKWSSLFLIALGFSMLLFACRFTAGISDPENDPAGIPGSADPPEPVDNAGIFASLITDKDNYPMTSLDMPGYLETVTDPEFGAKIMRISNAGSMELVKPLYSTIQAWNCDESRLVLWKRGENGDSSDFLLLDGETYEFIKNLNLNPSDIEQVIWDTNDPEILYYPESRKEDRVFITRFVKYNVETDFAETLHDFKADGYEGYDFGFGGDPQFSSWDSKVFGFYAAEDPDGDAAFTFNIDTCTYGGIVDGSVSINGIAPVPGPSGELFYYGGGVYNFQMELQRTLDLANPYEHSCLGRLPNGHDAYFSVVFGGPSGYSSVLEAHDMTSGERIPFISEEQGYPYPPSDVHISAIAYKNSNLVAVSIVGEGTGQTVFDNEILLVDTSTGIVGRVCHHRSLADNGTLGYWSEPHVTISPGGTKLIFASDWGTNDRANTFVIDLTDISR